MKRLVLTGLVCVTVLPFGVAKAPALSSPRQVFAQADTPNAGEAQNDHGDLSADTEAGVKPPVVSKPTDFNRDIYYRNRLEFSFEGGWLPINIPNPLDPLLGDPYHTYPLHYTLAPFIASLRWQPFGVSGPWFLRGNFDLSSSFSFTAVTRGPESRYFAYIMSLRRNFVPRNSPVAPYFDIRLGVGNIDHKGGPGGIKFAQGENTAFTMGSGVGLRYNFSPKYSLAAGVHWMHISNLGLSGRRYNFGTNVVGPLLGFYAELPSSRRRRLKQVH